jgi:hypothetical protein
MPANIDFVPFLVNYANDCATGITYMARSLTKIIFAGVSVSYLFYGRHLFNLLDKNTGAVPPVLPREYAK